MTAEFGPVLRKFRKAAGLSQERLAATSGVSVEAIKTLESGRRRNPRSITLRLLGDGLGLTTRQRTELAAAASPTERARTPRQLPDDLVYFNGRGRQVAELERLFTAVERRPGVVLTSAVAGMGGIGKTALGVHVAHRVAERFPDGQLYLNLRGFGPARPMTVLEALGRLSVSLGLEAPEDPDDVHEAAARYRSALAGRRVLVVLDDAVDAAQVAPLLPGASTCAVLITSRRTLTGLPGVAHLSLDVLPDDEALRMLEVIVGDERIANDPVSALSIVRLCGALPLALHIAGGRLADQPTWTAADLNARLTDSRRRLDELSDGNRDVRASIEFSLTAGDTATVAAFELLGLHHGEELDLRVAATLLDLPIGETEERLEHLVDLHLLESVAPRRYRMHDLIRSYVQETTARRTDAASREAARLRVLRLYLAMAWRSRELNFQTQLATDWGVAAWTAAAGNLSMDEIFAWFDIEIDELAAAVRRAVDGSPAEQALVAKIVLGLLPYFHIRRRYPDGVALATIALATVGSDPFAAALTPYELAQQCGAAGLYEQAVDYMTLALQAPKTVEYAEQHAEAEIFLGEFLMELGRLDEAAASAHAGVARAASLGAEITEADGRLILGTIAGRQDLHTVQDQEFQRAVDVVRRRSTPQAAHYILLHVGISYRDSGQLLEAAAYFELCRTSALAAGYDHAVAEALEGLGQVELARSNFSAAEQHLRDALDIVQGTWQPEARIRELLGQVLAAADRRTEAEAEWRLALDLLVRHGSHRAADDVRGLLSTSDV
ncbi:helix-turn-helix domain-containing protein [Kribbella antibiotica]|uniref:Helix-turn-helix domain-containing protein n=1 Tax=Kribbella antibiotica TaxID=190195 RepID=A0A4V2YQ26_9ACTN|nr:helix-turn-helix domain-containing protein [Kribbella antibiotica]TDD60447.1 helix-turn-helix domain-containing protein [Kribbella antibiotica]